VRLEIRNKDGSVRYELDLDVEPHLRFELVQPDGSSATTERNGRRHVTVLGSGGYGVVVRARDNLGIDKAVKFLRPSRTDVFEDLKAEILANQRIPKKHTAPIISWGFARTIKKEELWYYVMPFLAGTDLDEFFNSVFQHFRPDGQLPREILSALRNIAFRIFREVLLGLEELEYEKLAHMDVSPTNIRVVVPANSWDADHLPTIERELKVFLIDLGVARRYSEDAAVRRLPLACNPTFFPERIALDITIDVGGRRLIDPARLRKWGPRIDLNLFGRLLDFLLHGEGVAAVPGQPVARARELRRDEWRHVIGEEFEFLRELARRLQDTERTPPWYNSVADVREIIEALMTPRSGSGYDSELLNDHKSGIQLRVPDALVRVAYPLYRVVDHPFFQRLRNLKQLAFLDQVYPGGVHSRFTHSLQVFNLMKRYVVSLSRDTDFRLAFQRRQVDTLLTAALIHDIGHFPFAHTIEDLRKLGDTCSERIDGDESLNASEKKLAKERLEPLSGILHDHELATRLLDLPLENWHAGKHKTLRALLEANEIDVEAALYMLAKGQQVDDVLEFKRLGRDLVAGLIDADRLSYLQLDSQQTGVKFGLAVDLDSLIENLRVRPPSKDEKIALAVDEIAIPAVEAVLAAVYWMYQNVYWHPRNRGFMAAVKRSFQRLLLDRQMSFESYWKRTLFQSDHGALSYLSGEYSLWLEANVDKGSRFDPIAAFLSGQRMPLEPVWELGQARMDPRLSRSTSAEDEGMSLYDLVAATWTPWVDDELALHLAKDVVRDETRREEIFFDLPLKPRLKNESLASPRTADEALQIGETIAELHNRKSKLWVYGRDPDTLERGQWRKLGERSAFANQLWKLEDIESRKMRIFFSRELAKKFPDEGQLRRSITESVSRFFKFAPARPEAP
jgi:HD superfamily phosphohydrolase